MKVVSLITILLFALISHAQERADLTVIIDNVTGAKGKILVSVSDSVNFMKGQVKGTILKPKNGKELSYTFTDLPKGHYAVSVLHDENEDGKMSFNSSGMPVEKYGMSNNPELVGPPKFSDVKFILEKDKIISIHLQ